MLKQNGETRGLKRWAVYKTKRSIDYETIIHNQMFSFFVNDIQNNINSDVEGVFSAEQIN